MKTTIIINEVIDINKEPIIDVDPMILASMRERLNPSKPFSYANGDHEKAAHENEKRMRSKVFVKLNRRTKKFSGTDFFSGKELFKGLAHIPYKKEDCIIYTGNGNNLHPSHWCDDWFKPAM